MDHRICAADPDVFTTDREFLSFLVMFEALELPAGMEGRVVRHAVGDLRPALHHHAELEVNLVVRGHASYLLDERRYELAAGTLTWLFPGQEHVLVDESPDHALWWAVFRPSLVARTATSPDAGPLRADDPVGRYSRRLDPPDVGRLADLFRDLHDAQARDAGVFNVGLAYLLTAQMGVSISRFRNQQRVLRFTRLYGNGRRTTALAAAHNAGFGSYAQFYRAFRRETGHNPTVLRHAASDEPIPADREV